MFDLHLITENTILEKIVFSILRFVNPAGVLNVLKLKIIKILRSGFTVPTLGLGYFRNLYKYSLVTLL